MQSTHLLTRIYRIARIFIHTLTGLSIAACVLPLLGAKSRQSLIKWWCGGLLRAFHIKVVTFGQLPTQHIHGVMFVANHVSWADIHALNSLITLRFIAKSEIKSWPIFGYLAGKTNALFIDRSKRQQAGKIVEIAANSLITGNNLGFFPEGTTTDGTHMMPFKSSVLQAAISANTQVWPIAIRYLNNDGSINTDMAYAGETTLVESMKKVLMQANPVVEVHFLAPINAQGQDRRHLTALVYGEIKAKLGFT